MFRFPFFSLFYSTFTSRLPCAQERMSGSPPSFFFVLFSRTFFHPSTHTFSWTRLTTPTSKSCSPFNDFFLHIIHSPPYGFFPRFRFFSFFPLFPCFFSFCNLALSFTQIWFPIFAHPPTLLTQLPSRDFSNPPPHGFLDSREHY